MTRDDDALLAMLLGDTPATPAVRRGLAGDEGRRSRRALAALDALYGDVRARPMVYWNWLDAPIGRVLVAVSDAGVVRVGFRQNAASFVGNLARQLDAEVVRSPARTADVVRQLRAYFAGERRAFELPVDLGRSSQFQRRVLTATAAVPAGRLVSYGDIARRIGRPGGSRAVGQALGHNPVPIVIPCHRVIAARGRIGGYTGGLAIKRALLRIEGTLAAVA
jgi:methylated-DNA-[protein]-cysteine S-methyltransferase